jgi:hypothetical protein
MTGQQAAVFIIEPAVLADKMDARAYGRMHGEMPDPALSQRTIESCCGAYRTTMSKGRTIPQTSGSLAKGCALGCWLSVSIERIRFGD